MSHRLFPTFSSDTTPRWLRVDSHVLAVVWATLAGGLTATAAPITLDSAVVAAGGGTLAGGIYSVEGTTGQAVAGDLEGDDFVLNAGYWSVIVTGDAFPGLELAAGPGGQLRVTWPYPSTGFQLQWTGALAEPVADTVWTDAGLPAPSVESGHWQVTIAPTSPARFLRLYHP